MSPGVVELVIRFAPEVTKVSLAQACERMRGRICRGLYCLGGHLGACVVTDQNTLDGEVPQTLRHPPCLLLAEVAQRCVWPLDDPCCVEHGFTMAYKQNGHYSHPHGFVGSKTLPHIACIGSDSL